jgi:hypothetical protein
VGDCSGRYRAENSNSPFLIYEGVSLSGRVAHYFACPPPGEKPRGLSSLHVVSLAVPLCFDSRRPSPPWVPLRFEFEKNVGIAPEAHKRQGLARRSAWEKARKDWLEKWGMRVCRGEPRG